MKVICAICKKLVDEGEAIKMNMVEFKSFEQFRKNIPTISFSVNEHNIYTQICQDCWHDTDDQKELKMNIIYLNQYGDFDMKYTDSIYIGVTQLPDFNGGETKDAIIKILKQFGYKKAKTKTLTFTNDYYCNSLDDNERKDKRLRLT